MSDTLRKLIRELVEEELVEVTASGDAGHYSTPFAFRGNSAEGKAKSKKISTVATGYEPVEKTQEKADEAGPQDNDKVSFGKEAPGGLKKPAKPKIVQETDFSKKYKNIGHMVNTSADTDDSDDDKSDYTTAVSKKPGDTWKTKSGKTATKQSNGDIKYSESVQEAGHYADNGKIDYDDGTEKDWVVVFRGLDDPSKAEKTTNIKASNKNKARDVWKKKYTNSSLVSIKLKEAVNENRYTEFKMSEGTPSQKIGKAIREINRQIGEVDRVLRMNERLKKESGTDSGQLWKSTARGLTRLESKLNTISTRIRNLKA